MGKVSYEVHRRYEKKAIKTYCVKFHNVNDADVISAIECSSNKNDFFRCAIRHYLKKESTEST